MSSTMNNNSNFFPPQYSTTSSTSALWNDAYGTTTAATTATMPAVTTAAQHHHHQQQQQHISVLTENEKLQTHFAPPPDQHQQQRYLLNCIDSPSFYQHQQQPYAFADVQQYQPDWQNIYQQQQPTAPPKIKATNPSDQQHLLLANEQYYAAQQQNYAQCINNTNGAAAAAAATPAAAAFTPKQQQHLQPAHTVRHTPPESVSPKSSTSSTATNVQQHQQTSLQTAAAAAFSPHSTASPTSSSSSSSAAGSASQQKPLPQTQTSVRANTKNNKRLRQEDSLLSCDYRSTTTTTTKSAPNNMQSYSNVSVTNPAVAAISSGRLASLDPVAAAAEFDQYSLYGGEEDCVIGGGDPLQRNENPIKFQPNQHELWAQMYSEHGPMEFTVIHVEAEKGFNYSVYDQVHVCQKKNHFQVACQFQTNAKPCYVAGYYSHDALLNNSSANLSSPQLLPISDISLHMYGIKLDAPDYRVPLQQSKPDRSKQEYKPLLVQGLGEQPAAAATAASALPTVSGTDFLSQLGGASKNTIKFNVGRLHFAETTSNNMRKKGKPNRSQQYFALVIELCARTVGDNKSFCIMSMMSEKLIVRASNPGQFESNLDVTWLKSSNGNPTEIFHQGKVGINVQKPTEALHVNGNIKVVCGNVLYPSDKRIKTDIEALDPKQQLANVTRMKVYKYRYKDGITQALGLQDEHGEFHEIGFLAQEVAENIPDAVEISGDLTLVNGEAIENLLVVNKDRVFIETVAAVGELSRMLEGFKRKLERMENEKPSSSQTKNQRRLSRSDSLRSITSSVTQISNRLKMLIPPTPTDTNLNFSDSNNLYANRCIFTTPLNELDEEASNHDDEATPTTVVGVGVAKTNTNKPTGGDEEDFYSNNSTLSTNMAIDDQRNNRYSLASSNSTVISTTTAMTAAALATAATNEKSSAQKNLFWPREFDRPHSMALPMRRKSAALTYSSSASDYYDNDDGKIFSNFFRKIRRSKLYFLIAILSIIVIGSIVAPAVVLYARQHGTDGSGGGETAASFVLPSSDHERLLLLEKYKNLEPKMLTRAQLLDYCNGSSRGGNITSNFIRNSTWCQDVVDEQAEYKAEKCCAALQPSNVEQKGRLQQLQQQDTRHHQPPTPVSGSAAAAVAAKLPPVVLTRTTAPSWMQSNFESDRIIVDAPPSLLRRFKRSDTRRKFSLKIPPLNLTLDETYCQQPEENFCEHLPTPCTLKIPLQYNFPLISLQIQLEFLSNSSGAVKLCSSKMPSACSSSNDEPQPAEVEEKTEKEEPAIAARLRRRHEWQLPVGYYLSSAYHFIIVPNRSQEEFNSLLGGMCSLCKQPHHDDNAYEAAFALELQFDRICKNNSS